MSTKQQFNLAVNKFAAKLQLSVDTVVRRTVIDIHDRIVLKTPVDTGRARASWTIGVDVADLTTQPATYNNPAGAIAQAQAQQAKLNRPKLRRVYISNNLPYIVRLENGSSKQAPLGMVRIAFAEVMAELRAITST